MRPQLRAHANQRARARPIFSQRFARVLHLCFEPASPANMLRCGVKNIGAMLYTSPSLLGKFAAHGSVLQRKTLCTFSQRSVAQPAFGYMGYPRTESKH